MTSPTISLLQNDVCTTRSLTLEYGGRTQINGITDGDDVLPRDADLSSVVDFEHIGPFISLLDAVDFLDQADIDLNGRVEFDDISGLIGNLAAQ